MITKEWIGFVLIFLLASAYYYHVQKPMRAGDLTEVRGVLEEPVFFGSHGGDFRYEYARIRIKGVPKKVMMQKCSYSNMNFETIRQLMPGDSVTILAKEDFPENEFDAYKISSNSYGVILNLDDVNRCDSGTWKKALYLATAICFALFAKLTLIPLWKRLR